MTKQKTPAKRGADQGGVEPPGQDVGADENQMAHSNFRMYRDDYYKVKMLALQDGVNIQTFLNRAVTAYCATRGIELSGKDPHASSKKKGST